MYQAHRYPGVETEQDGNKSTKPHMSICCGDMDEVMDTGQVFYRPAACPAFVIFFFATVQITTEPTILLCLVIIKTIGLCYHT